MRLRRSDLPPGPKGKDYMGLATLQIPADGGLDAPVA